MYDFNMNPQWKNLLEKLKAEGVLKTPNIIKAFEKIDRKDFVPEEYKSLAYIDEALPTKEEQTISQPYTVAFMLELLQPKRGDKILDIGAGSGWQSALLACIVSKVYAIEIIPELCEFGKNNVAKYNFIEKGVVEWFCQSAASGFPAGSPFDKIISAASLKDRPPEEWFSQLKDGGRLVAPVNQSIWLFIKAEDKIEEYEYPGFSFVPFKQ